MKERRKGQESDKHGKISAIMYQNFGQWFGGENDGRQKRELDCGHPSLERLGGPS
jgi:hypothetical protein